MNYELGIREKVKQWQVWEWLFLLFIFLIPWQTRLILRPGILNGGNWEYGILGVYGTEILLWLAFLMWFVSSCHSREACPRPRSGSGNPAINHFKFCAGFRIKSGMTIIVVGLAFFFVNIFSSADKILALQSWRYIFEAIVVFFLIQRFFRRDWLIYSFLSGLAIQSVLSIWQFLSQSTFASRWLGLTLHPAWQAGSAVLENEAGRWLRAYSSLPHPNILGGYLAVGLILIVTLLNCYIVRKRHRVLLFTVYCLLLTALFFTFSRGAWIAWFIGLLVYWFISWREKAILQPFGLAQGKPFNLLILSSFLLFTFYFLFFQPLVLNRFTAGGRLEIQSADERLAGYHEAWQMFKKHPLLGVGLGNYTLAARNEIDSSQPSWAYQPAHNVFLLMLTEIGLLGLIFFVAFLLSALKIFNIQFPISLISSISLIFIISLFDHYLWSLYSGWMLLAAGIGLSRHLVREK